MNIHTDGCHTVRAEIKLPLAEYSDCTGTTSGKFQQLKLVVALHSHLKEKTVKHWLLQGTNIAAQWAGDTTLFQPWGSVLSSCCSLQSSSSTLTLHWHGAFCSDCRNVTLQSWPLLKNLQPTFIPHSPQTLKNNPESKSAALDRFALHVTQPKS